MPDDNQKPAQPKVPQPAMTRFEAQRKLGLFGPHDYVTLFLIVSSLVTLFFWWLFGEPSAVRVLAVLAGIVILMLFWIVVLCYRILVFLLDIQADINLMPETAARIVRGYQMAAASAPRQG
jgi:hypothetical protein